jgi:PPM family protein phosphatase
MNTPSTPETLQKDATDLDAVIGHDGGPESPPNPPGASPSADDGASTAAKTDAASPAPVPADPLAAGVPAAGAPPAAEAEPAAPDDDKHAEPAKTEAPPAKAVENGASEDAAIPPTKDGARSELRLRLFGRTDVGQVREHNEDNFIVADLTRESRGLMEADRVQLVGPRGTLLGVCDGMGGAAAGEVASQLAVDIIYQRMAIGDPPKDHDELAARLVHAIEAAGLRIFSEAKLDRTRRGMGTTATIAALLDDHLFLGQVGDSRAYILRGDRLVQVTRDQSLVNQLIEAGQLTEEEAETFEHNNIILQALGTADTVQVDLTYVELRRGDTLMLCSDGLSGMVRNDEIREVLRSIDDPLEACKSLTDRANQAGGHDNITVVVAKFEGPGVVDATAEDVAGLRYQKYQLPEPPAQSNQTIPEPSRKVKDLHQSKVSTRPPPRGGSPDIEIRDDGSDVLYGEDEGDADDAGDDAQHASDDPIQIPTDGAPQWLVVMMIASAVACVTIAGYYLLR